LPHRVNTRRHRSTNLGSYQYLQYHIDPLVAAAAVAQVALVGGALLLLDRVTPVSRVVA